MITFFGYPYYFGVYIRIYGNDGHQNASRHPEPFTESLLKTIASKMMMMMMMMIMMVMDTASLSPT